MAHPDPLHRAARVLLLAGIAVLLLAVLTACGGGSDDDDAAAPQPDVPTPFVACAASAVCR